MKRIAEAAEDDMPLVLEIEQATEDDMPRILEIEQVCIRPPWSHGALLSEIYREDSFFVVVRGGDEGSSQCIMHNAQFKDERGAGSEGGHEIRPYKDVGDGGGFANRAYGDAGGFIVGFVILRRIADEGELFQVAVDPAARRRGIADLLMCAALEYALDSRLKSVFLEVRKRNEAAISLYKKHGFLPVRQRKNYYSAPVEDAVVMVKMFDNKCDTLGGGIS